MRPVAVVVPAIRLTITSWLTSGILNTQPVSPMKALALLSTLKSADIVMLTTGGREIRLRRIAEPSAEQKELLR